MSKEVILLMNQIADFNYMATLIIYAKTQNINFKVLIIFNHLFKKNKISFSENKNQILSHPVLSDVNVEVIKIEDLWSSYESFDGIIVGTSGTITRLLKLENNNLNCRYVVLSYFNDKVTGILNKADLVFVNSNRDLREVSGLNVRIGNPYWDLYGKLKQYDFQDCSKIKLPDKTHKIIIPEIQDEYSDWYLKAYNWIEKNYTDKCSYIFKYRLKTEEHFSKLEEFKNNLKRYSNIYHVSDPCFHTTQKLLRNCDEVLFLSNRTVFIYECAKAEIKCSKDYEKPILENYHYGPLLIDQYIDNPKLLRDEIISSQKHATEYCFGEIIKLSKIKGETRPNLFDNLNVCKYEGINFSLFESMKSYDSKIKIFFDQENNRIYTIWDKNYRWANSVETGLKNNYFDIGIANNFYSIIKDNRGHNLGYISNKIDQEKMLYKIKKKRFLHNITFFNKFFFNKRYLNKNALVTLLYEIFYRALKTKMIFYAFNINNLWTDNNKYYINNLNFLIGFNDFFDKKIDQSGKYINSPILKNFNDNLLTLIKSHDLLFPFPIKNERDLNIFWKTFVKINKLKKINKEIT